MTRRLAAAAAVVAAAGVAAAQLSAAPSADRHRARPRLAERDVRTLTATATAFLSAVGDIDPAHPTRARARWARLVTPSLDRELSAHPPTLPAAAPGGTQRVSVTSVAVRPGPAPSALVLGVVTGTDGMAAPLAWLLTFAATPRGWRVAAVAS